MNQRCFRALLAMFFILAFGLTSEARRRKVMVSEPIRTELNGILKSASLLHSSLISKNESELEKMVDQLLQKTSNAQLKVAESSGFDRRHILEVLKSINNSLKLSKEYSGYRRSEALRSVFDGIVQIATNYKLDRYRMFYCKKDRMVWLQAAKKAQHPFDRKSRKPCGSAIR